MPEGHRGCLVCCSPPPEYGSGARYSENRGLEGSHPSDVFISISNQETSMTTRRRVMQSLPTFAVAGHMLLGEGPARAQEAGPLKGHFHPKGKAPSKFTLEVLKKARGSLPFADKRDFEEQKKG